VAKNDPKSQFPNESDERHLEMKGWVCTFDTMKDVWAHLQPIDIELQNKVSLFASGLTEWRAM
jgi:hypothetical protein